MIEAKLRAVSPDWGIYDESECELNTTALLRSDIEQQPDRVAEEDILFSDRTFIFRFRTLCIRVRLTRPVP
ncbi:hypothetical protein MRB53_001299 [Persea americana]|uniref:Uncharacterized protein n=1 Tax=Persea americana TaxID=3435 RepID=A0ACC2MS86_PERAE|nr:hypothetical protein MRB53_001299 [Persea americana]